MLYSFTNWAQQTNGELNRLIDSVINKYHVPSMALAIVKPDTCIYGIGGNTKINGTDSVTLDDKFHLGSNTKAITSFIAMRMVEKGALQLNTKFLPLFPEIKDSRTAYKNITLGDLLSKNAGIQPYVSGVEYSKLPVMEGSVSDKRLAFSKFVLSEPPVEKGTYSNAGYVLVSLLLEKVSEKTFEQLLEENMKELQLAYYIGFPNKENPGNPWGHWKASLDPVEALSPVPPDAPYKLADFTLAAGDLSMNIVDYSKFIQLHLKGLLGEDNYLSSSDYTLLHFGIDGYSYGWGNQIANDSKESYHDGSAGTYYCHTMLKPSENIAVIIMTNSALAEHTKAIYKLRRFVIKKYKEPTK